MLHSEKIGVLDYELLHNKNQDIHVLSLPYGIKNPYELMNIINGMFYVFLNKENMEEFMLFGIPWDCSILSREEYSNLKNTFTV